MQIVREERLRLALNGGKPVRATLLPYGRQSIEEEDIQAVVEVLRSPWMTTGPKVDEFEEHFASTVDSKFAVSFSSGTAALHGAAFAAELKPNDEAITTPMTFCATANCILYQGVTPLFADVCNDTLNISPDAVHSRLSPKTRAIIVVDYAGHPAELDELLRLAEQKGIVLIEDACHALGAEYNSRRVGNICHLTVFSFHPVKHIAMGEGGVVTTNDEKLARRLRMSRNHGIDSDFRRRHIEGTWFYEMVELGYNYRLTDIACVLGLSQLSRLADNLARRREIAERYSVAFRDVPGLRTPVVRAGIKPAWHLYPIRLNLEKLSSSRSTIFRALRAENIGVNVHYIPVHLHPYYRQQFGYRGGEFPIAEQAYEELISLPMFHGMSNQDVEDVIDAVTKVLNYYAG